MLPIQCAHLLLLNARGFRQRGCIEGHEPPAHCLVERTPEHSSDVADGVRCQLLCDERIDHPLHIFRCEFGEQDATEIGIQVEFDDPFIPLLCS